MVRLETARLLLRLFREEDVSDYARLCADAEVMRYLGEGQPLTRAEAWRNMAMLLGHWQLRGYGLWAVEERTSGALIGRIGLFNPDGWPGLEVGWMLQRASWGYGFATEGAQAALHYAFTELQSPHVISLIHPENAASIRVAERLGEQLEERTEVMGKTALVYGMHRADWEAV